MESLAIANRLRGLLAEFGIAVAKRESALREALAALDPAKDLPDELRELIRALGAHWQQVHERMAECDARIEAHARSDERCARLRDIIGVGPLTANATTGIMQRPANA